MYKNVLKFIIIFMFATQLMGEKTIIKMATLAPEGTKWHGMLVEMGQRWNEVTDGTVELRIYPGGVVGDERDMIRKIRIGQIHAAAITTEGLSELNQDIYALIIPLLFDDWDDVDWIRERLEDDLIAGIEKSGFKLLTWTDVGWVHWFTKDPMKLPEDLKGMKIFNWAGEFKTLQLWKRGGFNAVQLASIDILSGLQTGLINAMGTNPMVALASQWFGIANHMLDMRWGLLTGGIVIDKKIWGKIDPEYREKMLEIIAEIDNEQRKSGRYKDEESIEVMKQYGLKVHHLSEDELQYWKEYVEKWYPDIRGSYVPAEIFDKVIALKKEKDLLDTKIISGRY
ncbi:MAG: TRAP transporter substrate-binding protein DctP [Candidatus Neomarinimicrobiota bacterium]